MADCRGTQIVSAGAGAVDIDLPAGAAFPVGGIAVNSSDAGSVWSTSTPRERRSTTGAATHGHGGCSGFMVTTIRSGSVGVDGPVRNVDTSRAGSVKIGSTAPAPAATARMVAATAATALDFLDVVHSTAHGDQLRAFLAFVAGAAKVHARGTVEGRIILFASLAAACLPRGLSCAAHREG